MTDKQFMDKPMTVFSYMPLIYNNKLIFNINIEQAMDIFQKSWCYVDVAIENSSYKTTNKLKDTSETVDYKLLQKKPELTSLAKPWSPYI